MACRGDHSGGTGEGQKEHAGGTGEGQKEHAGGTGESQNEHAGGTGEGQNEHAGGTGEGQKEHPVGFGKGWEKRSGSISEVQWVVEGREMTVETGEGLLERSSHMYISQSYIMSQ